MHDDYLVAAKRSESGLIASPTSRSALGGDILAIDIRGESAVSVHVKTNRANEQAGGQTRNIVRVSVAHLRSG